MNVDTLGILNACYRLLTGLELENQTTCQVVVIPHRLHVKFVVNQTTQQSNVLVAIMSIDSTHFRQSQIVVINIGDVLLEYRLWRRFHKGIMGINYN